MARKADILAASIPARETTTQDRRSDIQGLRALAVLAVIAYHAGLPVPGGFIGVDIFFVISGFVITAMLLRERSAVGRIDLKRFYVRRFKRLTPAFALVLTATLLGSVFILSPFGIQEVAGQTAAGAILLGANIVIQRVTGDYFDAEAELNPLLHMWSLSVEEQFYLFLPALLVLSWLAERRLRRAYYGLLPVILVVGLAVVSFGLSVAGAYGVNFPGSAYLIGFYSSISRAWEFAAGVLIALIGRRIQIVSDHVATLLGFTGLVAVLGSFMVFSSSTFWPSAWTLVPVVGTALILVTGIGRKEGLVGRTLGVRPMVMVGDWSYSLYLWHWPFIVFATLLWPDQPPVVLTAAALATIPAVLSYHFLEEPIRRSRTIVGRRMATLVAISLIPPLAASALTLEGSRTGWWSPEVRDLQASVSAQHADWTAGCDRRSTTAGLAAEECTWNSDSSGPPIYLVGDSNAGHIAEAVISAGQRLERPVHISTSSACPFVNLIVRGDRERSSDDCTAHVAANFEFLEKAATGTVVISNSDDYWAPPKSDYYLVGRRAGGELTRDISVKQGLLKEALGSGVSDLRANGHQVLLVQSTPRWDAEQRWQPATCPNFITLAGRCKAVMSVEDASASQGPTREVLYEVAQAEGATVWDTWDQLCPGGKCGTNAEAMFRYRDATHISVDQSRALAPELTALLD